MNLEGGGEELSAPCINNEGVYLETRRDLILCAEREDCVCYQVNKGYLVISLTAGRKLSSPSTLQWEWNLLFCFLH